MAELVLLDASVSIGPVGSPVDLSDHNRQVAIDYTAEAPEITAMGDLTKTRLGGLLDWKMDMEFNQDYATSLVDATLFPLVGVLVDVDVCGTSAVAGATNPHYTGTGIITAYNPLSGKVGDVAISKVSIVGSGTLVRDITP